MDSDDVSDRSDSTGTVEIESTPQSESHVQTQSHHEIILKPNHQMHIKYHIPPKKARTAATGVEAQPKKRIARARREQKTMILKPFNLF